MENNDLYREFRQGDVTLARWDHMRATGDRLKEALGAQVTDHICSSPNCPTPHDRILMRDLYPVVSVAPRRRTVFYHKACGPKLA